ncbi:hypothetical protein GIB67_043055 [Kingdonia uniflora]|uniref:Alpha-L-arabinofuranosidase B arabinose-binding domain-containing protein n=1 Tax=Kingdonia uniflora TaxID=39325 RepID=A0A7J7L189_9MAGN|nr:hypothetical protein GIB67_043055 [Kingdonia uniflora]
MGISMFFGMFSILVVGVLSEFVRKECTNIPTQLGSHSLRYELLMTKNESWRNEMFSHYHVVPTDDSAWAGLFPRKVLKEEGNELDWAMLYWKIKNPIGIKRGNGGGNFLNEVSLHDVRLDENSFHGKAQQTNLEYLLILDVDRLVWSFRKTAGLPTPGEPYGGWEATNMELRGHFVGHYMSASAQMWASTHNKTLHEKMYAVVNALRECQKEIGTGYLSAFPTEYFDRFEAIKPVWAPYYTIHKILAGLLDQYSLSGNTEALKMAVWMVDYFNNRVQDVISKYGLERHWQSLNEEVGGMNDVLYNLYSITGDEKHLVLAHLFDKPCFLGLLAVQADSLSGFHANTHIPVVIGSQMRYEVTGDPLYKAIGTFFMELVNSSHSYATGGTSVDEFWSEPKRMANTLKTENEESCTTYNMLKVSRNLFRWTKEMAYAEYYERALTNGVLGVQRGREPGVMIYMLPQAPGTSKAMSYHGWGNKFDSFWCCYGTGIESFSKLGDSIYFEEETNPAGLYVIQFISSSFDWKAGGILLHQKVERVVSWDPIFIVKLTISSKEEAGNSSTLNLRIPQWTYSDGAKATLNAKDLPLVPGTFLSVSRKWSSGDQLTLQLPMILKTEAIKDDRPEYGSIQAILYGPYLLAGLTKDDWDIKTGIATSLYDWITPIPSTYNSHLISLSQEFQNATFVLTNLNHSVTMEASPKSGSDTAVRATFRLISEDLKPSHSSYSSSSADLIGKSVMLEPMDFPGMVIVIQGPSSNLAVGHALGNTGSSTFQVVAGLDGKANSISLESGSENGCFVYSEINDKGSTSIKLSSKSDTADSGFKQAASFNLREGLSEYHPMSFVAKGAKRNFLLMPLFSLRDESYTVYFKIGA